MENSFMRLMRCQRGHRLSGQLRPITNGVRRTLIAALILRRPKAVSKDEGG
jgi:hypothetical protein